MMTIDLALCPICKNPNACAIERARVTGNNAERCWCFDADISEEVLDQVPDEAKGVSCVCGKCAGSYTEQVNF
ncbi:MAG: cysteine-rich CWC family protein [Alcaligenaceae bacterium]|nr:cysteine-rich CWC family protein [Alcaligenaceae bacterium]